MTPFAYIPGTPTPPAPPGPLVAMNGVGKRFGGGTLALEGLSLSVLPREFLSLLGPSGCGKSTALRILAGLLQPSSGEVRWPGLAVGPKRVPRGEIGFVFQEPTLMPWQTVFGNVWLPLRLRGIGRARAREQVMASLAAVGLAAEAGAYPRELSGGMKMRVSIARALVTKPRLLLMDEPFGALDEITRHRLNDDLLRLWRQSGTTIVFVTHSVFESAYLSTRIAVMRPQPGRVFGEVLVPAGDRSPDYRTSEPFRQTAEAVSRTLRQAVADAGEVP